MFQPLRLALPLALVLEWGATARAEPAPGARVRRERSVTVASAPADSPPIIHVARDTMTLLFFPSPIQRKTLTFDESRLRVLDAGERSVIVQPLTDLPAGERQELGVFFSDGKVPARAAFTLVTDPAEVDIRIEVQRPAPPNETCPTDARAPTPKPEDFVLLGYLDAEGVSISPIKATWTGARGLEPSRAVSFRGKGWILVDMMIVNGAGQPAWAPLEATFTGRVGVPLRARIVTDKKLPVPPGESRRVLAVAEIQEADASFVATLEIRGDGGRHLSIPDVQFPKPGAGVAQ
ncbi:DUF2381 family protein [Corallococcus macrosporus]|uniref:DUF2381 family protein n=1 Tax=Corallococcus macrosporus DSM 14697 TaxID=1189310 RepID=A0A250JY43_9BACT|nr:DUF2381 family protein [Corallococcus macrosporus]ATB48036.1 hypothetical protein MYMAC_003659 [Corallococcus macrosporus DSM 14697]